MSSSVVSYLGLKSVPYHKSYKVSWVGTSSIAIKDNRGVHELVRFGFGFNLEPMGSRWGGETKDPLSTTKNQGSSWIGLKWTVIGFYFNRKREIKDQTWYMNHKSKEQIYKPKHQ